MMEKNLNRCVELVEVLNRAVEIGAMDAPSAKLAKSELEGLNKLLKEGFTLLELDRVTDFAPADIMLYFIEKEGKYQYTNAEFDTEKNAYVVNDKKVARLYYPAVEVAYHEKHGTYLASVTKYLTLADIIRWKCQNWRIADDTHENGEKLTVTPMTTSANTMFKTLCEADPKWEENTSNGIAFAMEEFRKAILPEGVEPPAYFRNADRVHFAIALLATQKNKEGEREYKDYRTNAGQNAFFALYFDFLRMAYHKTEYKTEIAKTKAQ